jgi:regulator of protease activity HflC (stomatin/prohibitin superfamily)
MSYTNMLFGLSAGWDIIIILVIYIFSGLKVVTEYQRGVRFTLGKFTSVMKPGLRIVFPIFQKWKRVDMRIKAVDVPNQDCMTRDNVSLNVNAVLYYKVDTAQNAILKVENYNYAVSQLAQTTMRDVVGEVSLDKVLSEREMLSKRIQQIVDKATDPWGIKVESVELKHIELAENLKRTMAKEAEAEREKRAVIIKASGEVMAAKDMAKAASILSGSAGALHLRTLQTLNDLSSDQSNTIVFATPIEVLEAFKGLAKKK